ADTSAATQLIAPAAAPVAYDDALPLDEDDDYDDEDESQGFSWWAVALGTIAVLAIAGLIGYLLFKPDSNPQATVPNLVGMTQAAAEARLTEENLEAGVQTQPTDDPAKVDTVLSQDPGPNQRLDEGSTVTINIGVAPDAVAVPSVVGRPRAEAEKMIEEAGLVAGNVTRQNSDRPADEVLSTDPAVGTEVAPNTTVNLVVSSGEEEILVPDLAGKTRAEAEFELTSLGLVPQFQDEPAGDRPVDQVVRQTPAANTPAKEGDEVFVTVTVPNDDEPTGDPTTGNETGQDNGNDTGNETGQDTGTDTGTETGTETGSDTGTDTGTETGTDTGTETGGDGGGDSGTEWG
ncbi:MAG TPA: PASTA domain-containing protein, partial [Jiangellaceae bacterium]